MNETDELTTLQSFIELGVCLMICLGAAVFGAFFTPGEWYDGLVKPPWTPPDLVFPWVWTILYITMGVAVWLYWRQCTFTGLNRPLLLFVFQLLLNAAWSYLFFGLHAPGLALWDASLLLIILSATVVFFWRSSALAGIFLLPYLFWMFFAVSLNFVIWRLNA